MESLIFLSDTQHAGQRIDVFVTSLKENLTRSAVQKLCGEGRILVNGAPISKNYRLRGLETIEMHIPPVKSLEAVSQNIPVNIVYEDEDLIVVDKPKGMVVHPAAGNEDGTLVNALLYHCAGGLSGIGGVARPGIVHRIDKDTSGLLVVAKSETAHNALSSAVKLHNFTRIYHAVCYGNLRDDSGTIDAPIGRHPIDRKRMCVTDKNSKKAITHFTVRERFQGFTYITLKLETGRTHQIRVHLSHLGHPLAGDPVYGPKKVIRELGGQCLHAETLGFTHPVTGSYLEFHSPLPPYFVNFHSKLRSQ